MAFREANLSKTFHNNYMPQLTIYCKWTTPIKFAISFWNNNAGQPMIFDKLAKKFENTSTFEKTFVLTKVLQRLKKK